MKVQSVLIPKLFPLKDAIKWVEDHYHFYKVDETERFYRFRQFNPIPNAKYITKKLKNGIELVIMV